MDCSVDRERVGRYRLFGRGCADHLATLELLGEVHEHLARSEPRGMRVDFGGCCGTVQLAVERGDGGNVSQIRVATKQDLQAILGQKIPQFHRVGSRLVCEKDSTKYRYIISNLLCSVNSEGCGAEIDRELPKYILWYMSKTLLSVKTDVSLKQSAKETAEELGLSLGTVVNAFLRQFVRERSITISASYKPSAYLRDVLLLAEQDHEAGKFSKEFKSMDAMLTDLKK